MSQETKFPGKSNFPGSPNIREVTFPGKSIFSGKSNFFWEVKFPGKSTFWEVKFPRRSDLPDSSSKMGHRTPPETVFYNT